MTDASDTESDLASAALPTTGRAVRFDRYGDRSVLHVAEVPVVPPGDSEVLVEVKAAATNPGEAAIRQGFMDSMFPSTFPSGQGTDFAGVVVASGSQTVGFSAGLEVIGWSEARSSQASHVTVPATQLVPKPKGLSWEVAGSLFVVGVTAVAAVEAMGARAGETVVVSAAAGGVGSVATQMLLSQGVGVVGIASEPNHEWLRSLGARPVAYGDGLASRIRELAPDGVDALLDTFGDEYVRLGVELGIPVDRIETIIAFGAAAEVGAKTAGSSDASTPEVLGRVAALVADGTITIPIAGVFPLDRVQDAFEELEQHHTHGKIVLIP